MARFLLIITSTGHTVQTELHEIVLLGRTCWGFIDMQKSSSNMCICVTASNIICSLNVSYTRLSCPCFLLELWIATLDPSSVVRMRSAHPHELRMGCET
ncbi:hypothetical protein BJ165DRAFT_1500112 [Panaeolus papilionaceus]|nr:hypothetical protein BJ165DRAFT_1500112 [Panaeolus papilionaceus]